MRKNATRKPGDETKPSAPKVSRSTPSGVEATGAEATDVGSTDVGSTEESAVAEAPLNRAERRARKKGGPKPDALGKLPPGSRQSPRRESSPHAPRQWAMRRSG